MKEKKKGKGIKCMSAINKKCAKRKKKKIILTHKKTYCILIAVKGTRRKENHIFPSCFFLEPQDAHLRKGLYVGPLQKKSTYERKELSFSHCKCCVPPTFV